MDDATLPGALEDVAFLARSANRVRILDALARQPSTRRGLAEATDVARTTLDRIVVELEDRGWVERTANGEYAATAAGEHLVAEFRPFLRSVAAIDRLGEAVAWLPTESLPVGLEQFADATVMRPERDVVEVLEYMRALIDESERFRAFTHLAPPDLLERAMHDGVVDGDLTLTIVTTGETLSLVAEQPRRRERWREIVAAGGEVYRHEGPFPCSCWTADGTVLVKEGGTDPLPESYGVPIVSEDEAVLEAMRTLIDRHVSAERRLEPSAFAADSAHAPAGTGER